jgi:hypothetical protein
VAPTRSEMLMEPVWLDAQDPIRYLTPMESVCAEITLKFSTVPVWQFVLITRQEIQPLEPVSSLALPMKKDRPECASVSATLKE